ncbi:carbonic anhydrase family protein [Janthinobacterium sp.]|uniref:carbonic anhydrase n=1 Tax=Janthinobacterium sp. TaxID=1871054 RepID=UPI00293D2304|nr:carbonic anhydrase family protein [Janthinobacterium sp.]
MRTLIALLACSFVMMAASANDPPAGAHAPASEAAKTAAAKTLIDLTKPKQLSSPIAPGSGPSSARGKEEQSEMDLSAKIAARLAEMRATQAARVAAAARSRKAAAAAATRAAAAPATTLVAHGTHWSYEGETGPANWGRINSDWTRCGTGSRQSPIDIRDGMKVELEQISFDYKPSSFNVVDNGHTVQVTLGGGNYITVQGRMYELMQFHFHRPSEERVNGKGYEMVVHLVHKDAEGKLAVLAILLERGKAQATIQTVWNNLPLEKNEVMAPAIVLDPMDLLPQRRDYFTYMGSLTTPPCSEGVLWLVMKEPQQASPAQMALFSRLYPLNARPIQSGSGRMIKESN